MYRIIGFVLVLTSFSISWCWMEYKNVADNPLPIDAPLRFQVKSGDSLNRVAQHLSDLKLLKTPLWFKILALVQGQSDSLKAGEYLAPTGITGRELLAIIVKGKVQQHTLQLVEGWTFKQVFSTVCSNPAIIDTACSQNNQSVMRSLGFPGEHPEGRFFPDTYYLIRGTTDIEFLDRALKKMNRVLEKEWGNRAPNLPFSTPYETLILASIIEKETGRANERSTIAGVFVRRLQKGMLLQTDPTVIYGMGERFDGNIRFKDLREDTAYNTYVHPGLPPTPIALPGVAAIHAALHPKAGKSLYFVANGNGGHVFSATLKAHNRAVNKYQRNRKH